MKHICPDWPVAGHTEDPYILGCGQSFEQEPDDEGWVDCPHCGLAFNAKQARSEYTDDEEC